MKLNISRNGKDQKTIEYKTGPVELVDLDEINMFYPGENKDTVIEFRRMTFEELFEVMENSLDDEQLAAKLVKTWSGFKDDKTGEEVEYKPKYLYCLPTGDVGWIVENAAANVTVQCQDDLPDEVTFILEPMTGTKRKILQQKANRGFKPEAANKRLQQMIIREIVKGWEGVYYKGNPVAYSIDMIDKLPCSLITKILKARPGYENNKAQAEAIKN